MSRGMFEPSGWVDRVCYAVGVLVWPYCAGKMFVIGEYFTAFVLTAASVIGAVWTWRWVYPLLLRRSR